MSITKSLLESLRRRDKLKRIEEARSATELRTELQNNGVDPTGMSRDQMERELAKIYWELESPGTEMPGQYDPMLAKADPMHMDFDDIDKVYTSDKYYAQQKYDGMRAIMEFNGSTVRATSRERSVKNFRFTELHQNWLDLQNLVNPFNGKTVLDGEALSPEQHVDTGSTVTASKLQAIVALFHMRPQQALAIQKNIGSIQYVAYDILYFDGRDVQDLPYEEREKLVNTAILAIRDANPGCSITAAPTVKDFKSAISLFKEYIGKGYEGVMMKLRTGKYRQGARSSDLQKIKEFETIDGFITGSVPASEDKAFANLIGGFEVSAYVDGKEKVIAAISNIPLDIRKDATVIVDGKPQLNPEYKGRCLQMIGQGWGKNSRLMSARIDDWRDDKAPEQCTLKSSDMGVKVR